MKQDRETMNFGYCGSVPCGPDCPICNPKNEKPTRKRKNPGEFTKNPISPMLPKRRIK